MGLSRFELPIELRSSVAYLLGFSIQMCLSRFELRIEPGSNVRNRLGFSMQMCLSRIELPIELGADLLKAPGAPVGQSEYKGML